MYKVHNLAFILHIYLPMRNSLQLGQGMNIDMRFVKENRKLLHTYIYLSSFQTVRNYFINILLRKATKKQDMKHTYIRVCD